MATITSNSRYIEIDGRTAIALSDNAVVNRIATGVRVKFMSGSYTDISYEGTTVDGVATGTAQELYDWFKSKGFSSGGGAPGEGVQWSDTAMFPEAGKIPVFSPQGLLSTGTPEFPENCVPLFIFDSLVGNYLRGLQGYDADNPGGQELVQLGGDLQWVDRS